MRFTVREEGVHKLQESCPEDYKLAAEALEFAKKAIKRKPRLLILDEMNLAVHFGILKTVDILKLLEEIPEETTLVLTGRRTPKDNSSPIFNPLYFHNYTTSRT